MSDIQGFTDVDYFYIKIFMMARFVFRQFYS